jgi:hypothetical protein
MLKYSRLWLQRNWSSRKQGQVRKQLLEDFRHWSADCVLQSLSICEAACIRCSSGESQTTKFQISYRRLLYCTHTFDFFFLNFLGFSETQSTWHIAHYWPIVPAPDDGWWWVWSSQWEGWQGKQTYSDEICAVPRCSSQIPHDLIWARTRAAAVENQQLTTWDIVRPNYVHKWATNERQT